MQVDIRFNFLHDRYTDRFHYTNKEGYRGLKAALVVSQERLELVIIYVHVN